MDGSRRREIKPERLLRIQREVDAAAKVLHQERCREWRAKNPEKSRAASQKWKDKHPREARLTRSLWRFFNRDKHIASCSEWRKKNPNYQREYRARKKAEAKT